MESDLKSVEDGALDDPVLEYDAGELTVDLTVDPEVECEDDAEAAPAVDEKSDDSSPTSSRIFVGGLGGRVGQKALRERFSEFGVVTKVDVINNLAFVQMADPRDADAAIRALNNAVFNGRTVFVDRATERKRSRKTQGAAGGKDVKIFVGRVKDIEDEKLKEAFGKFGTVVSIDRPRTKPEIAFVRMETFFESRRAVEALHKKSSPLLPHPIVASFADSNVTVSGRRLLDLLDRSETVKLFVGGLKEECDVKDLGRLFERHGPVFEVGLPRGKDYGFVHLLCPASAMEAIRSINGREFNGNRLHVVLSKKRGKSIGPTGTGGPVADVATPGPGVKDRIGARSMIPLAARRNSELIDSFNRFSTQDRLTYRDGLILQQPQTQFSARAAYPDYFAGVGYGGAGLGYGAAAADFGASSYGINSYGSIGAGFISGAGSFLRDDLAGSPRKFGRDRLFDEDVAFGRAMRGLGGVGFVGGAQTSISPVKKKARSSPPARMGVGFKSMPPKMKRF